MSALIATLAKGLFVVGLSGSLLVACSPPAPPEQNARSDEVALDSPGATQAEQAEFEADLNSSFDNREDWEQAIFGLREYLSKQSAEPYPLDFAASPSVRAEHYEPARDGVQSALAILGPKIPSTRPLALTVVSPDDEDWFLNRWEELGRDNTGDFWWKKSVNQGGGAVGWGDDLVPNMYYMVSDRFPPPSGSIGYYVHESLHFLQVLSYGDINNRDGMCWIPEGTAQFLGLAFDHYNEEKGPDFGLEESLDNYQKERNQTINALRAHYNELESTFEESVSADILDFPAGDPRCQFEAPYFGYSLGMLVAERFLVDFGPERLFDFFSLLKDNSIPDAFELATSSNYEEWVATGPVAEIVDLLNWK